MYNSLLYLFTHSKQRRAEQDPNSILNYYKKMVKLRKSDDLFTYGTYNLILEKHPAVYAYTRTLEEKTAVIISNLTDQPQEIDLGILAIAADDLKLANYEVEDHQVTSNLILKPFEARIYKWENE